MWTAIGVGILVVAQAGGLPGAGQLQPTTTPPQNEAPTTGAPGADLRAPEAPPKGATSATTVRFRNDVGDAFQLSEARFTLDGQDLPALLTSADHGQDYVIFTGAMTPGRHVISSHVTYQGRSRSIFTYMKGYTFTLDTTHELNIPNSGATSATIVGRPNKGFNVPFENSLKVDLDQPAGLGGAR
jgi:hypothetical protein